MATTRRRLSGVMSPRRIRSSISCRLLRSSSLDGRSWYTGIGSPPLCWRSVGLSRSGSRGWVVLDMPEML